MASSAEKFERVNLPPSLRTAVFIRDGFRCTYCGARPRQEELHADHVIPVSKGGTNDIGNLVTACRTCNIGKGTQLLVNITEADIGLYIKQKPEKTDAKPHAVRSVPQKLPSVPVEAWKASQKCHDPVGAWLQHFSCFWDDVDRNPDPVVVDHEPGRLTLFHPSMVCRGRRSSDVGNEIRVLLVRWRDEHSWSLEDQLQIRNAVISGYQVPTIVIVGPPDFFYGVAVTERHKGCPRGAVIDTFLQPFDEWDASGWYPDECWTFQDLREPFRHTPHLLTQRHWNNEREEFVGVYSSCEDWCM